MDIAQLTLLISLLALSCWSQMLIPAMGIDFVLARLALGNFQNHI